LSGGLVHEGNRRSPGPSQPGGDGSVCQGRSGGLAAGCRLQFGSAAMTLDALVTQYIAFRTTARGENFASHARVLRHFSRTMGTALEADAVQPERVKAFLDGTRPLSRYWHRKYSLLQGFYRYALARG